MAPKAFSRAAQISRSPVDSRLGATGHKANRTNETAALELCLATRLDGDASGDVIADLLDPANLFSLRNNNLVA
jgi:hypothetical protein